MKLEKTFIDGLLLIQPGVYPDERGLFYESYQKERYRKAGINFEFVQDNISHSVKGTVRGLHYQAGEFAQGKLCEALLGKVLDIAVDIRFGSPTFGKHFSIELSGANHLQLYIPPGFAHGFAVLSEKAVFHYKCTNYYNKESERGIVFNDEDLNIDWKVDNPVVSEKDFLHPKFKDIQKDFVY